MTDEKIEEMRAMVAAADAAKVEAADRALREAQCAPYAAMIQSEAWATVQNFVMAQRAVTANPFAVAVGSLAQIMPRLAEDVRAYLPAEPEPEPEPEPESPTEYEE